MSLREVIYEDRRWMKLSEGRVQWRDLILAVLNIGFCYHSAS